MRASVKPGVIGTTGGRLARSLTRSVRRHRFVAAVAASLLLGATFLLAGLGKMGQQQTEAYIIIFGLPRSLLTPTLANYIDEWLPRVEIALGALLVTGTAWRMAALASLGLTAAFIFNNGWVLSQGLAGNDCGCFGNAPFLGNLTTAQSLYIDIGMLAAGLVVFVGVTGGVTTLSPWFLRKKAAASSSGGVTPG